MSSTSKELVNHSIRIVSKLTNDWSELKVKGAHVLEMVALNGSSINVAESHELLAYAK